MQWDPRSLFIIGILEVTLAVLSATWLQLGFVMVVSLTINIRNDGLKGYLMIIKSLWSLLLISILLIFVMSWQLGPFTVIRVFMVMIIAMTAFTTVGRDMNADQLVSMLISAHIPSGISWSLGMIFRQLDLNRQQMVEAREMYLMRIGKAEGRWNRFKMEAAAVSHMITVGLAKAFHESSALDQVLIVRGFKQPHVNIMLEDYPWKKSDGIQTLLIVASTLFIWFSLGRELFMLG